MREPYSGGGARADALPVVSVAHAAPVPTAGAPCDVEGMLALWAGLQAGAEMRGEDVLVLSAGVTTESIG